MWKWVVGILVVLALLCGGGGFFFSATAQGRGIIKSFTPEAKPTEVRIDTARRGDLVRVVSAPGTIEPRTKVAISAQVSARIIALPFRVGDKVKKGDVLVRLDAGDYLAALTSAQAALKGEEARLMGARAGLAEAEASYGRTRELYDSKDMSKADLDTSEAVYLRAKSNLAAAEFSVEIAKSNIVRAEKNLAFTTITAPLEGQVVLVNNEVGEQVLGTFNNAGSVIMEIADLSTMVMKAKVDETNVGPVRPAQSVRIYINSYPDRVFEGTVELVGLKKLLDRDGTGYFETEVLVKQNGELRSGYNANCDIVVETFSSVLKVPSQAVVDRRLDDLPKEIAAASPQVDRNKVFARVVYRLDEAGKTIATPVSVGASDLTDTIIISGINDGDRVVTGPFRVLVDLKHEQQVVELGTKDKDKSKDAAPAAGAEPKDAASKPAAETKPAAEAKPAGKT